MVEQCTNSACPVCQPGTLPPQAPTRTSLEEQLLTALKAARDHLNYCGYGDRWERECADAAGLSDQIEAAIAAADK